MQGLKVHLWGLQVRLRGLQVCLQLIHAWPRFSARHGRSALRKCASSLVEAGPVTAGRAPHLKTLPAAEAAAGGGDPLGDVQASGRLVQLRKQVPACGGAGRDVARPGRLCAARRTVLRIASALDSFRFVGRSPQISSQTSAKLARCFQAGIRISTDLRKHCTKRVL